MWVSSVSINVSYPSLKKHFFWSVGWTGWIERVGIGGYYNTDTISKNTTSTTRVNLKTYTFKASAKSNMARIRVYAHVSGAVNGSTIYLNVNATDVTSVVVTSTSSTLAIDYIGNITSGANNTINVDGAAEGGYTLYIDKVVIITGLGLTSTSPPVNLFTITLDTSNTDSYILDVSGNFDYKLGVRYWINGNRKTTVAAYFRSTLANEIQSLTYPSFPNDDGDNNNAIITMLTGDYPGDNASFTISGNVGAFGDAIIITGVYVQLVLRGNVSYGYNYWTLLIKEKGVVNWAQRLLSIDGTTSANFIYYLTKDVSIQAFISADGVDVFSIYSFPSNSNLPTIVDVGYNDDTKGVAFPIYINIVVSG